jgi:tRNA pseudouridine38-40 synthase
MEKPRAALWLWYRGDRFAGFQAQPGERTVQQAVREALVRLGARDVVMPAGRTDRGVHARMQVVSVRASPSMAGALDFGDEKDVIGLAAAAPAPDRFHAQWSATQRTYRYRLALGPGVPPAWVPFAWTPSSHPRLEGRPVDPEKLEAALALLPGTRTFAAFHDPASVRKPRTLVKATLHRDRAPALVEVELQGDAFGRHQVRELVGACALLAAGRVPEEALREALSTGVRFPGLRAPPTALVLWEVQYPAALDPFGPLRPDLAEALPGVPPFVPVGTGT